MLRTDKEGENKLEGAPEDEDDKASTDKKQRKAKNKCFHPFRGNHNKKSLLNQKKNKSLSPLVSAIVQPSRGGIM